MSLKLIYLLHLQCRYSLFIGVIVTVYLFMLSTLSLQFIQNEPSLSIFSSIFFHANYTRVMSFCWTRSLFYTCYFIDFIGLLIYACTRYYHPVMRLSSNRWPSDSNISMFKIIRLNLLVYKTRPTGDISFVVIGNFYSCIWIGDNVLQVHDRVYGIQQGDPYSCQS